ncbi:MauE/DoxX family redox-associated membrane protein [Tenacibaculum sp.]|uniref:MauE/DoxX family redox-associated membrane protein n=1 Tax=Tenacibaculum sp. TaxID=1906242 RepID=UPI003D150304
MKWQQKYISLITEIISILFIILFVYAAVSKLLDFQKFRVQVGQSPILTSLGNWIVIVVPVIEILISIGLMLPKSKLNAMYGALTLMTIFTTYIVFILNFSPYVPCSCGGILDKMGWKEHLIFNLCFVLLAIFGILLLEYKKQTYHKQISI